jgi:hypothetical protein
MTERLKKILPRKNISSGLVTYKNCFSGQDAVSALMKRFNVTKEEAIHFGRQLQEEHRILADAEHKSRVFDESARCLRLQCYDTPNVLNSYRVWTEPVDTDCIRLVNALRKIMDQIENDVMDDGGLVDLKAAAEHEIYPTFEEAVCELQGINLSKMDDTTKIVS